MIFGEDYGQLAASGEYEVYKSGTTLASLNEAIAGLSDEEYYDSFLAIITDAVNAELIHLPARIGTTRRYNLVNAQSTSDILYTQYWQSNVLYYREKNISSGSLNVDEKSTSGAGTTLLTITSWKLYRRQKSYDVAISGSKAASAIAPVQDSLATANRNYSVGEQFYYDGHLYKVTAAITSGAQIVLGTNAELTDDVTKQIKEMRSSTLGTAVDISGYTASNRYTFPSDGYAQVNSETLESGKVQLVIVGGSTRMYEYMNITGKYQASSVYVRKGMSCYINSGGITSGASAKFYPFT